jgi:hypothetical protein
MSFMWTIWWSSRSSRLTCIPQTRQGKDLASTCPAAHSFSRFSVATLGASPERLFSALSPDPATPTPHAFFLQQPPLKE